MSEMLNRDIEWCTNRRQPDTIDLNRYAINGFISVVGDKLIVEVTSDHLEAYLNNLIEVRGLSKTSCNIYLKHIKAVFQRAISEHGLLTSHPFKSFKPFSIRKNKNIRFLTKPEIVVLVNSINDLQFKRLVNFYLWTGCRRSEALDLTWSDIDWHAMVLYLGREESKTKVRRPIPISPKVSALLREIQSEAEASDRVFSSFNDPRGISKRFARLSKSIEGFPDDVTPHTLRHTFASHLIMNKIDLTTVAQLMGHSTTYTTEIYAHLLPEHKRDAIDKLGY